MSKPRMEPLWWIVPIYLMSQGWAIAHSAVSMGAVSQLPSIGLTQSTLGAGLMVAGVVLLFASDIRLRLLLAGVHLPLLVAGLLVAFKLHIGQSLIIYVMLQFSVFYIILNENENQG